MNMETRTGLATIKTNGSSEWLEYAEQACPGRQRRFEGRISLAPVLDLTDYGSSAVVDWLQLRVRLNHRTQFQWIQQEVLRPAGTPTGHSTRGDDCLVKPRGPM